jgi:hypothetical protein
MLCVRAVRSSCAIRNQPVVFACGSQQAYSASPSQGIVAEDDATMAAIWSSAMQERFDRLEVNVDTLGKKIDTLDTKVVGLERKIDELDRKCASKADSEQLREDIKKLGEGYEAGFQGIARQIADIDRNWDYKWSPHDLAIRDHEARLKKLERK